MDSYLFFFKIIWYFFRFDLIGLIKWIRNIVDVYRIFIILICFYEFDIN